MRAVGSEVNIVNLEEAIKSTTEKLMVIEGNVVLVEDAEGVKSICKVILEEGTEEDNDIDIYHLVGISSIYVYYEISVYRPNECVYVGGSYMTAGGRLIKIEGICDISITVDNIKR